MPNSSFDRVLSFNDQLIALIKLGLPMDFGVEGNASSQIEWLRQTSADLALRSGRGGEWDQSIDDDQYPAEYRHALKRWLTCDEPTLVFDGLCQRTKAQRRVGEEIGRALIQPLILFVLAYVGFVFFCLSLFPKIQAVYSQMFRQPGTVLSFLETVQAAMVIWVPLIPVIVIAAVIGWMIWSPRKRWRRLPGSERYYQLVGSARFADQVADLVQRGTASDEAISLLRDVNDLNTERTDTPLLRWALTSIPSDQSPPVLRFVASFYRSLAWRRSMVWRTILSTLVGVFFGGLLVLGYGLALFLPVTELMKDLARIGGG